MVILVVVVVVILGVGHCLGFFWVFFPYVQTFYCLVCISCLPGRFLIELNFGGFVWLVDFNLYNTK